eukprot:COSAG01_NODE_5415_length_4274_cov_124.064416_3_plen_214_part_00
MSVGVYIYLCVFFDDARPSGPIRGWVQRWGRSKSQYAELVRDIQDTLQTHMSGSGLYDFAAPETMELHPAMDMPFWVHDSQMEGSGFFSSIGKAFKNVYSALKKSGVIDNPPYYAPRLATSGVSFGVAACTHTQQKILTSTGAGLVAHATSRPVHAGNSNTSAPPCPWEVRPFGRRASLEGAVIRPPHFPLSSCSKQQTDRQPGGYVVAKATI